MRPAILCVLLAATAATACAGPAPSLDVATDREYYLAESRNTIYVQVRISSTELAPSAPKAAPKNIAFVLDRSGSMAGEPVRALREAVNGALASLTERDIISIILFGSEVQTLVPATRLDQLQGRDTLLAEIQPAGGAALYDALNQGAAQLRRYAAPGTINQLVLVTDGPATKGPRESDDFIRLVEVFAHEGFALSTIGLGQDFDEDQLAALARSGSGHFRYVEHPARLAEALIAEVSPLRTPTARDATLTLDFTPDCEKLEPLGWTPATVRNTTATFHFPHLFEGQDLRLLFGATLRPQLFPSKELATARLRWTSPEGEVHEVLKTVSISMDRDARVVRESANPAVIRSTVNALIGEAMQRAIEQIDEGNFGRAARTLRRARDDSLDLNETFEDPDVAASIRHLESYLSEVQTRGINQLDRKILRSGLHNRFESPPKEETSKR